MKKILLQTIVILTIIILTSGIALSTQVFKEIDPGGTFNLVLSTATLGNSGFAVGMQKFAEEMNEVSGGKVTLEIFADGRLMTNEGDIGAVRSGEVDMTGTTPGNAMDLSPWFGMLDMPYNFVSYDHMVRFYESQYGKEVFERVLEEQGIRILSYQYYGTRHTFLRDIGREVRSPKDMKGLSIRAAATPIMMAIVKGLGAEPTPITIMEAFSALMTGTVDGMEYTLPAAVLASLFESCKYVIPTSHMVNIVFPTINEKVYQKMTPEFQKYLYEGAARWMRWADQYTLQQENNARETLEEKGMIFIDDIDLEAFKANSYDYIFKKSDLSSKWDILLFGHVQALSHY